MAHFAAFEHVEGDPSRGLLLIADHAMNRLPPDYGDLGLPAGAFRRHIAYDIGIETLTRAIARRLGVPAVMAGFSRLLIDPNRGEDDPTLIMRLSDGAVVPGNHPLTAAERERRLRCFHRPYHRAVEAAVEAVERASGRAPLLISLHSFTSAWKGVGRPWHVCVLWDRDDRAPRRLLAALAAGGDLVVGDNEPYDGALRGDTMYRHGTRNGLAHALIELRQDLIADAASATAWADRLAPILEAVNGEPDLHVRRHYGSRTGPVVDAAGQPQEVS